MNEKYDHTEAAEYVGQLQRENLELREALVAARDELRSMTNLDPDERIYRHIERVLGRKKGEAS